MSSSVWQNYHKHSYQFELVRRTDHSGTYETRSMVLDMNENVPWLHVITKWDETLLIFLLVTQLWCVMYVSSFLSFNGSTPTRPHPTASIMARTFFTLLLLLLCLGNCFDTIALASQEEGLGKLDDRNDLDDLLSLAELREDQTEERVCVTLFHYGNVQCHGDVKSTKQITAWTKKGSPCRHTGQMQDNSVKDQYSSINDNDNEKEDGGGCVFHQTVFVHNKHCHVGIAQKAFSPQHLSYKQDKCTYGYKLKSCVPGACPESPNNDMDAADEMIRELRY